MPAAAPRRHSAGEASPRQSDCVNVGAPARSRLEWVSNQHPSRCRQTSDAWCTLTVTRPGSLPLAYVGNPFGIQGHGLFLGEYFPWSF